MSRIGRPTESKKDICIKLRIDKETDRKLEWCMEYENTNKSEIIRRSIIEMYEKRMNGAKK